MEKLAYISNFEKLGMGVFVHFGVYSKAGKGEWYKRAYQVPDEKYFKLVEKFKVKKTWAKELVSTAKKAGAKYITLTTRHHDGFSLFDTCGLNDYDAPHSPTGRDLVREFVDECNKQGIVPFFYHTLLDWYNKDFKENFPAYIEYLIKSVEILCTNYGKIGGLWFDGWWSNKEADWQFDRLYATIRRLQPDAMIINNTGLGRQGEVGHPEIDSVTFERGKPCFVDRSKKYVAGEMCQVLNNHWGYAAGDINYKSVAHILGDLVDCRRYDCNFLLNLGPMGNGTIRPIDKAIFELIGSWIKVNKKIIYNLHSCEIQAENAYVLTDGEHYYAAIYDVPMRGSAHVVLQNGELKQVKILTDKKVKDARWLDNGKAIKVRKNAFQPEAFGYGINYCIRFAKFDLK